MKVGMWEVQRAASKEKMMVDSMVDAMVKLTVGVKAKMMVE